MKHLKLFTLFSAVLTFISTGVSFADTSYVQAALLGGGAVGNGGGSIVKRDSVTKKIEAVELLDFFEARELRQIEIDVSSFPGSWKEKVEAVILRLGKQSELRLKIYSEWLRTFETETKILKNIDFNQIPDALPIGVPTGWKFEQAAVQIIPRFPGDARYYLNEEIWAAMDDTQKAGLVLHEIVYREALSYGHTDSVATRYFISQIASKRILDLNLYSFIDLLRLVRFEQTDFPIESESGDFLIQSEFSPINWWRKNFTVDQDGAISPAPPAPVQLHKRIVVNVGFCKTEGCTDWEDLSVESEDPYRSLTVCSGQSRLLLSGGDEITFPVPLYSPASGKKLDHCSQYVKAYFSGDYSPRLILTGKKSESADQDSLPILHVSGNMFSEIMTASILDFGFNEGKSRLKSIETSHLGMANGTELFVIGNYDLDFSCHFEAEFNDGKIERVRSFDFKKECRDSRMNVQLKNWKDYDLNFIQPLQSTLVLNPAPLPDVSSIKVITKHSSSVNLGRIACLEETTCFSKLTLEDFPIEHFQLSAPFSFGWIDLEGMQNYCEANAAAIDFWPTLFPKSVTLKKSCTVPLPGGGNRTFPAGTQAQLKSDGQFVIP